CLSPEKPSRMLFLNAGRAEARPCPAQIRSFDVCDPPARLRSVPLMFAIHPPESGIASEFKNWPWKSAATLERLVKRLHEIVDFFLANDQWRQNFDDIHVVAGD